MKHTNKALAILLAVLLLVTLFPSAVLADEGDGQDEEAPILISPAAEPAEDAEVSVTVSNSGSFVTDKDGGPFAYITVTVSDRNADGKLDIDETLYAAHEALYPGGAEAGYAVSESEYGLGLSKLWGDESGLYGYNVNDVGAYGMTDEVKAGDHVYAYVNASFYPDNEGYAYFEKPAAEAEVDKPFALTLSAATGEYDPTTWAAVFAPCEGAEITVDGVGQGVLTDAEGKAEISFPAAGEFLVSATKTKTVGEATVTAIVAPVCIVKVTEAGEAAAGFEDVAEDAYYAQPVAWAVENGITTGVDDTHFGPETECNRAQAVTFLWRAAGCPESSAQDNPFADVTEDDYFYQAVLWAVEKGITTGKTETSFAPTAPVTRAEAVTFLWRAADKPDVSGTLSFTDVDPDSWYGAAVKWASDNGVTVGVGDGIFGVNDTCTRAQIVTFLYRSVH